MSGKATPPKLLSSLGGGVGEEYERLWSKNAPFASDPEYIFINQQLKNRAP